jgi:hypothetical protein
LTLRYVRNSCTFVLSLFQIFLFYQLMIPLFVNHLLFSVTRCGL